jgi:DnaJ-class molecular chaperone
MIRQEVIICSDCGGEGEKIIVRNAMAQKWSMAKKVIVVQVEPGMGW